MRLHPKPDFPHDFDLQEEIDRIKAHQIKRGIPKPTNQNLIIATWNLTNFGLQEREDKHIRMMAEIARPFDVIAVQEVADNIKHLSKLLDYLGADWDVKLTDVGGNTERLGFIFKKGRLEMTELAAELAMKGYERNKIVITVGDESGTLHEELFMGFNRNPYMLGFKADGFLFTLVNVHLYWSNLMWRRLEATALAKWAKSRVKKLFPPNNDIILIGDFNMYKVEPGDVIYDDVVKNGGLVFPKYETEFVGTNLAGDGDYDELAFFPSRTEEDFTGRIGVFDFDDAVFAELWPKDSEEPKKKKEKKERFFQYIRYYLADHRPLWAEFHRLGDN